MIAPLLPTIAPDLDMSLPSTALPVVIFTLVLSISSPVWSIGAYTAYPYVEEIPILIPEEGRMRFLESN